MKKPTPKKTSAKLLVDAPAEKRFWVNKGPVLKNLKELHEALGKMTKEQIDFHTKRAGNDFARWIRQILGAQDLAKRIRRLKTRESITKEIEKYLK